MTEVELLLVYSCIQDCLTVCKQMIKSEYNDLYRMRYLKSFDCEEEK